MPCFCRAAARASPRLGVTGSWPQKQRQRLVAPSPTTPFFRVCIPAVLIYSHALPPVQDILQEARSYAPLIEVGLQHGASGLRVASVKAACALLIIVEPKTPAVEVLSPLAGPLLGCVGGLLTEGDELRCRESLEALIELAKLNPAMVKAHLDAIGQAMSSVAASTATDEDTRRLAMELMTTTSEAHAGMARKSAAFVQNALLLALTMVAELDEEDGTWNTSAYDPHNDTSGDADDQSICATGEQALIRLGFALGGDAVLPVVFDRVPGMVASGASWQHKRAALMSIALLAESCKKALRAQLDGAMQLVMPLMQDGSGRVRHAAICAVGMMASAFKEKRVFLDRFGETVVPAFSRAISVSSGDGNPVRVAVTAAASLIDIISPEVAQPKDVQPCLQDLLVALMSLLRGSDQPLVAAKALSAIATVARVAGDHFKAYYGELMPAVTGVITNPPSVAPERALEVKTLQGTAMECAALMGEAVGKEAFAADAGRILDTLLKMQQAGTMKADDPQAKFIIDSIARIAKVVGAAAFAPYVPIVLPPLLAAATREVKHSFTDIDADQVGDSAVQAQANTGVVTTAVNIRGVGTKQIQLNVTEMQERAQAVDALAQYIRLLGAHMAPHINEMAQAMLPNLTYKLNNGIRKSAASCFANLVGAAAAAARVSAQGAAASQDALKGVLELAQLGLNTLLQIVQSEHNAETRQGQSEAVADILGALLVGGDLMADDTPEYTAQSTPFFTVPLEMAVGVVSTLMQVLAKDVQHHLELVEAAQQDEDADEETMAQLEEQLEANDDVIRNCVDGIGYLIKAHRAGFLPIADAKVVPVLTKLLTESAGDHLNFCAMCTFADLVEWCGEGAHKYADNMMPCLLLNLNSDYELMRQCSLYTVGQLAVSAPAILVRQNVLDTCMKGVMSVMSGTDAMDEDNINATENAISTMGKLLLHVAPLQAASSSPGTTAGAAGSYWKAWMQKLPLREDMQEAKWCNATLAAAVAGGDAAIMGGGQPPANLPLALLKLSDALVQLEEEDEDVEGEPLDADSLTRVRAIFKQIATSAPAIMQQLPEANRAAALRAASA